jgi:hypothetical protein
MSKKPEEHPKGTLAILLIFLLVTLASWFGVYALLVQRGGM